MNPPFPFSRQRPQQRAGLGVPQMNRFADCAIRFPSEEYAIALQGFIPPSSSRRISPFSRSQTSAFDQPPTASARLSGENAASRT